MCCLVVRNPLSASIIGITSDLYKLRVRDYILGKNVLGASSCGNFKVGDRVYVEKPAMALTKSAEEGGAWNVKLEQVDA